MGRSNARRTLCKSLKEIFWLTHFILYEDNRVYIPTLHLVICYIYLSIYLSYPPQLIIISIALKIDVNYVDRNNGIRRIINLNCAFVNHGASNFQGYRIEYISIIPVLQIVAINIAKLQFSD